VRRRRQLPILVWLGASVVGTCVATWALFEVVQNWRALMRVRTPYADILAQLLVGNLYQQIGRLVMEGICLMAGLIAWATPGNEPRNASSEVVAWLLVSKRLLLVSNSAIELWTQREQRHQWRGHG
jgi:hypothetical protein